MSTIYYIHKPAQDTVQRLRKLPKKTSTNARIVRAVFGDESRKLLYIPLAIDDYNHHTNGADIANQRRRYHIIQRKHTIRA
jgi:hypothetical protein